MYRNSSSRRYGKLKLIRGTDGSRITGTWIFSKVDPFASMKIKQFFSGFSPYQTDGFKLSDTLENASNIVWFTQKYKFEISEQDESYLIAQSDEYDRFQASNEKMMMSDYVPQKTVGFKPGYALYDFQERAVDLLIQNNHLFLGDDVGLGKTYTAIGAMLREGNLPCAVVVKKSLKRQWIRVIEKITNLRVHFVKKSSYYDLPEADVYVFKYRSLIGWAEKFSTGFFKFVVYDEIQELRTGSESSNGSVAQILSRNAQRVLGMTATAVYNYASDIFNVLNYVKPGFLTESTFQIEWCNGGKFIKNPDAFRQYMTEQFIYLARSKKDVGMDSKKPIRYLEPVDYDEEAVKSTMALAKKLALRATTGTFVERGQAARELDIMARMYTGVSKAKYVAEFVKLLLEREQKVLLIGWHRDVYKIWLEELAEYKPVMFTGSESEAQKEKSKKAFIEGDARVMIMSAGSGDGTDGLQYVCSTIVIGELAWSHSTHYQCIGRLDRPGQENIVSAYFLYSEEGSDPPMMALLGMKKSHADALVGLDLEDENNVSMEEKETRASILANYFLKKNAIDIDDAVNSLEEGWDDVKITVNHN